jgi:CubicO group peptidase (beta-lactamase class C family)
MLNNLPRTRDRIEQLRDDKLILHGIQLYVSVALEVVADMSTGEARPGVDMTADTICRQHCTGVPLTVLALASLVASRTIGLDQPVCHFIPAFAANGKDRISIRHVLTHTAGLHACDNACFVHSEAEILNAISAGRLPGNWVVGATAAYSNVAGWHVIGSIVEKVVGVSLSRHLRDTIFDPLGMPDTWVGMPASTYEAVRHRLGVTYFEWDDDSLEHWLGTGPTPMWHDIARETCGMTVPSGAYSTCRDLGQFYEALVERDRLPSLEIVDTQTLEEFLSVQRSGMYDSGLGRVCDYGLGFMLNVRGHHFGDYCSPRSYGHSGIHGSSLAFADEPKELVIALLCNDIFDWQTCFLRRTALVNAIYEDLNLR